VRFATAGRACNGQDCLGWTAWARLLQWVFFMPKTLRFAGVRALHDGGWRNPGGRPQLRPFFGAFQPSLPKLFRDTAGICALHDSGQRNACCRPRLRNLFGALWSALRARVRRDGDRHGGSAGDGADCRGVRSCAASGFWFCSCCPELSASRPGVVPHMCRYIT